MDLLKKEKQETANSTNNLIKQHENDMKNLFIKQELSKKYFLMPMRNNQKVNDSFNKKIDLIIKEKNI